MDAAEPTPPRSEPEPHLASRGPWARLRHLIVHNILHLDDTPHRIALGVFLGFLIGATPTIGIQMVSYFALAAVLGANKVSGIGPVWISNPVTAVPLYYSNWLLGRFLLTGETSASEESRRVIEQVVGMPGQDMPLWERILSMDFWRAALDAFVAMGLELWIGSVLVGLATGILGYWATYRAVIAFRKRRASLASSED